jgi:hypothetical protein
MEILDIELEPENESQIQNNYSLFEISDSNIVIKDCLKNI